MLETNNFLYRRLSRRRFLHTLLLAGSAAAIDWRTFERMAEAAGPGQDHPVVVIGAGLGGLVAAAYLCKHGFPVTVIEMNAVPGGYASCFEREDFVFDVSLHATVAEHGMPQMILSELGIWEQLDVVYTPELCRIITSREDVTLPAKDPEGVKQALVNVFPHEKRGIHGFYAQMEQVIDELWSGQSGRGAMMANLEKLSLEEWMRMHVTDPELKHCMAIFCGYYGLCPERLNALFYAIATGEYLVHGGQYYKTRSRDLSRALARAIRENGGRIMFNTQVEEICFSGKQGRITGVKDTGNNIHPASAVIANCSVPSLFSSLIPEQQVASSYRKKLNRYAPSYSSVIVWLGLNRPLDQVSNYGIDISLDNDKSILNGQTDPARSGIGVTIYDNLFQGYSPPGKSTLSIMTLSDYGHWQPFEEDYFKNQKTAYYKEKERIAGCFINKVQKKLIPGLKDMIEVMEVGTPLTNIYYTGNSKGAIYGFNRDEPQLEVRTPVKGLYLASAWSHGGGYTPVMMAGREAATALLGDIGDKSI